jgi:hypothetical protein
MLNVFNSLLLRLINNIKAVQYYEKKLFKLRLFRYQIIWNYNGIAALLGTLILKMATD